MQSFCLQQKWPEKCICARFLFALQNWPSAVDGPSPLPSPSTHPLFLTRSSSAAVWPAGLCTYISIFTFFCCHSNDTWSSLTPPPATPPTRSARPYSLSSSFKFNFGQSSLKITLLLWFKVLSALSDWRTPRIRDASNVYTPCATPTTVWPEVIAVVVFYCVYLAAKWHFIYLTRKNLLLFLRETLANIFIVQTTPTPVGGQDNPHPHTLVSLYMYIYVWCIGVINTAVKFTSTPKFLSTLSRPTQIHSSQLFERICLLRVNKR